MMLEELLPAINKDNQIIENELEKLDSKTTVSLMIFYIFGSCILVDLFIIFFSQHQVLTLILAWRSFTSQPRTTQTLPATTIQPKRDAALV
jgi:hypothetical protein